MTSIPAININRSAQLTFFSILLLISGAAGLIYEVIWERLLEIYFGVTMTSITLIVSAYLAGLGLGSLFGGRIAQRLKSPLFTYGLLEIGIGVFGLLSPLLIGWIGQATAGSPYWLVFIISFAFLLLPTFLMGMTLPLLTQAFIDRVETSGQVIGILYGINTLGAAFGCLIAGYILIDKFGFNGASVVAVIANGIVGLLAIASSRVRVETETASPSSDAPQEKSSHWKYQDVLLTSFLVGFIGLGFEMLWFRILNILNKHTSYGFASLLFVFLVGLALGGYFWGRRADRSSDIEKLFWQVEVAAGIIASLGLLFLWVSLKSNIAFPGINDFWEMQRPAPPFVQSGDTLYFSRRAALVSLFNYFLPILLVVFPASFILGGGLPILDRIAIKSPEVAGRRVGDIHLANIIGSVLGSLVISFWMLPNLGTEWTHKVLVLLGMTFPILYFMRRTIPLVSFSLFSQTSGTSRFVPATSTSLGAGLRPAAVIFASLTLLIFLPGKGQFYKQLYEVATDAPRAIIRESSDSVLAITLDNESKPAWLWIGGEPNSFYPPDGTYESRGIVCAGASQPKRALIIGMGGGVAARFFQTIPGIEEIVIVELLEDLGSLLEENVEIVQPVFDDPRIQYVVDDGRRYLYANPNEKFDMISIDPLRWYSLGHNNLYSLEAMQLYQSHLTENGVFCAYTDQTHSIPYTMSQVFPHVDQYSFRVVVASSQQIQYDLAYMESITQNYVRIIGDSLNPGTEENLRPEKLLSDLTRDRDQIIADENNSPVLMDLNPVLEYYFLTAPIKRPIWLKSSLSDILFPRILNCGEFCE